MVGFGESNTNIGPSAMQRIIQAKHMYPMFKGFKIHQSPIFSCDFSRALWVATLRLLTIQDLCPMSPLDHCHPQWEKMMGIYESFPIFIAWGIWKVQNKHIFEGRPIDTSIILPQIMGLFTDYIKPLKLSWGHSLFFPPNPLSANIGFFEGTY